MRHNRAGYVAGCRCGTCGAAQRDYMREYMRARRLGITAADRREFRHNETGPPPEGGGLVRR